MISDTAASYFITETLTLSRSVVKNSNHIWTIKYITLSFNDMNFVHHQCSRENGYKRRSRPGITASRAGGCVLADLLKSIHLVRDWNQCRLMVHSGRLKTALSVHVSSSSLHGRSLCHLPHNVSVVKNLRCGHVVLLLCSAVRKELELSLPTWSTQAVIRIQVAECRPMPWTTIQYQPTLPSLFHKPCSWFVAFSPKSMLTFSFTYAVMCCKASYSAQQVTDLI